MPYQVVGRLIVIFGSGGCYPHRHNGSRSGRLVRSTAARPAGSGLMMFSNLRCRPILVCSKWNSGTITVDAAAGSIWQARDMTPDSVIYCTSICT